MGSYTSGMEDEQISVNAVEEEMPSIGSNDLELERARNSKEDSVDVGIENTDFVNNGRQGKVIKPDVVLDVHKHRLENCVDQDEPSDQEIVRRQTAVDILKKDFGTSTPVTSNNINDLIESRDVSVDLILKIGTDQQGKCRESGIKNELCIEQDPDNLENVAQTSNDEVKWTCTNSDTDCVTNKEHIYCTVYCMANDNYRRSPLLDSLREQNSMSEERQIISPSPVSNHTNGNLHLQTESDLDLYYNEPFTISSVIDTNSLGNLYSGDYKPFIVLTCRVCLEDKHIKPLHCCKKAVCEECLKRYLSSQIHIQRTEGCDHMTCSQCNTNFCYRCGERYRQLRFFGDHTSNLSIFGCKFRYLPEKPHLRRLVRGSVCASKILIAPLVLVLVVVFGAVALVIGVCSVEKV
ncbi:UNVERIFIED_CONTAM: hypothetical protein FKN15_075149 [Acipenser sinensis]